MAYNARRPARTTVGDAITIVIGVAFIAWVLHLVLRGILLTACGGWV